MSLNSRKSPEGPPVPLQAHLHYLEMTCLHPSCSHFVNYLFPQNNFIYIQEKMTEDQGAPASKHLQPLCKGMEEN